MGSSSYDTQALLCHTFARAPPQPWPAIECVSIAQWTAVSTSVGQKKARHCAVHSGSHSSWQVYRQSEPHQRAAVSWPKKCAAVYAALNIPGTTCAVPGMQVSCQKTYVDLQLRNTEDLCLLCATVTGYSVLLCLRPYCQHAQLQRDQARLPHTRWCSCEFADLSSLWSHCSCI